MTAAILSILPVLLFFILGYILKCRKFLKDGSSSDIKKIASGIALPALLFQAFASLELERRYLLLFLLISLICSIMILLGRLTSRLLKVKSPYWSFMMGGFEMGMLGYALFLSLYGQDQLPKFALMDLGQLLFVFFILVTLLVREKNGHSSCKAVVISFLSSPVILAIFAGLLTGFLKSFIRGNALTDSLYGFIVLTGNLTVPLISLMIGYELNFKKEGLSLAFKTVLVRKILLIAMALLVNRFFIRGFMGLGAIYEAALFTMFLLPPPFIISIYMNQDDRKNLDYVNNTLSLSTVISTAGIIIFYILWI